MREIARPVRVNRLRAFATVLTAVVAILGSAHASAQETPHRRPTITLNERNDLASLVDLCAERLDLNIEYDEAQLRGATVTLRLGRGVTDEGLWDLTNRLLAAHGWTSVQMPGDEVLSIVKLSEAPKRSRFGDASILAGRAGFTSIVRRINRADVGDMLAAIKPLLTQPGGVAVQLGGTDLVIVSDLAPRLQSVLDVVDQLDAPRADREAIVDRIALEYVEATELVAQVNAAVEARNAIEPRPLSGRIAAGLDGQSIVLVTPPEEAGTWRGLIAEFDEREPVVTRTYSPGRFPLEEVAGLIEQLHDAGRGSGDRWKLVRDELLGTLIITATNHEHESIQALLERLDDAPPGARRTTRLFTLRNRDVSEVLAVLEGILDDGSPPETPSQRGTSTPDSATQGANSARDLGRTDRESGTAQEEAPVKPSAARRADVTAIATGSLSLTTDESRNLLIASGEAHALRDLESLIEALDTRQAQVEIQITIASLNESDTLDVGVELQKLEVSGSTLVGLSSLFGISGLEIDAGSPLISGRGFSGVVLNPGDFSVVLRALETIISGSSHSFPKMLVNDNQAATLDSVRQEPITQLNASDTVATTSFAGFESAGTQVTVTPQIAEGDHLVLEYSISLSAFVGESSDPSVPPPRQESSLQSVVTIPDGYAIAVGGIDVTNEADAVSQVPLLGNLPGIGELFKSRSRSASRSKFYVFIRADVLRHDGFEDLKYLSAEQRADTGVDDGWPVLEPRIIE